MSTALHRIDDNVKAGQNDGVVSCKLQTRASVLSLIAEWVTSCITNLRLWIHCQVENRNSSRMGEHYGRVSLAANIFPGNARAKGFTEVMRLMVLIMRIWWKGSIRVYLRSSELSI